VGPLAPYLEGKEDLSAVPLLIRALRDNDAVLRRNAAVALERLTGRRTKQRVERDTPASAAAHVADAWGRWLAQRRTGRPGR